MKLEVKKCEVNSMSQVTGKNRIYVTQSILPINYHFSQSVGHSNLNKLPF